MCRRFAVRRTVDGGAAILSDAEAAVRQADAAGDRNGQLQFGTASGNPRIAVRLPTAHLATSAASGPARRRPACQLSGDQRVK